MTRTPALALMIAASVVLSACGFPQADTPLGRAADEGKPAELLELLARGADPNQMDSHGLTPLVRASRRGYVEIVQALLAKGADPNLFDAPRTRPGWTPLMNAVHKGQLGVVRALLAAGADVNLKSSDGTTALMLASGDAGSDVLRALLDAGADPKAGRRGSAALTNAVLAGRTANVKALLEKDPDLRLQEGLLGRVAIVIARLRDDEEILELLEGPNRGGRARTRGEAAAPRGPAPDPRS